MKHPKSIPYLLLLFLLLNIASSAQDTPKDSSHTALPQKHRGLPNPQPLFPRFPGGNDSLAIFIATHTHYPNAAKKHHISGIIEVDFTVGLDGTIKNPKILNHLGYGCDEEAIRVVNLMPKWIPATKGREPMELDSHVNIAFGKIKNQ